MAPYNIPFLGGDWYVTRRARKKEYIEFKDKWTNWNRKFLIMKPLHLK